MDHSDSADNFNKVTPKKKREKRKEKETPTRQVYTKTNTYNSHFKNYLKNNTHTKKKKRKKEEKKKKKHTQNTRTFVRALCECEHEQGINK